ncbi:cilia- and flagella-associated protein 251-like [Procambarus clarkii]|uniref:cilia- and flagella-associated protein 251-like n=1 Tax=Procambarus clarkii TaxID=6728 RepID=UPI003742E3B8
MVLEKKEERRVVEEEEEGSFVEEEEERSVVEKEEEGRVVEEEEEGCVLEKEEEGSVVDEEEERNVVEEKEEGVGSVEEEEEKDSVVEEEEDGSVVEDEEEGSGVEEEEEGSVVFEEGGVTSGRDVNEGDVSGSSHAEENMPGDLGLDQLFQEAGGQATGEEASDKSVQVTLTSPLGIDRTRLGTLADRGLADIGRGQQIRARHDVTECPGRRQRQK